MKRTLFRLGHSTAVTLPPKFLQQHGLKAGDVVEVENTELGIVVRPQTTLDPNFEEALRTVLARYRKALKQLAEYDQGHHAS